MWEEKPGAGGQLAGRLLVLLVGRRRRGIDLDGSVVEHGIGTYPAMGCSVCITELGQDGSFP